MLSLLPLAALGSVFLAVGNLRKKWGWPRSFVRSLVLLGAYLVLGTELLSLFRAITPLGLSLLWLGPITSASLLLISRSREAALEWPRPRLPDIWPDRVLFGVVVTVAAITALVAWLAPPNTWDSLTYHTARVAHWAQNRSVAHYATGIERQNVMSPGAEFAVLHAYVLAGGDRLANFVQWGAMIAALFTSYLLSRQLGSGRTGAWFSAAFVSTLPMGIAQASSTMTDYVVALWVVVMASELVTLIRREHESSPGPYLGLAAGLAILTKPTAFGYLLPLLFYGAVHVLRRDGMRTLARSALTVASLSLLVNAGYFARNLVTYGHPLADRPRMQTHANQGFDLGVVISNTLRNASLHAGTPWDSVNREIFRLVVGVHVKLGLDVHDPRTTVHLNYQIMRPRPDEARSGNPVHALLALLSGVVIVGSAVAGRGPGRRLLPMVLVSAAGFVILSSMFRFTVFGSRYHVAFFVLAAAWVASLLDELLAPAGLALLGVALLVAARSWLVELGPRPILTDRMGRGLFVTERSSLYLLPNDEEPIREIADRIQSRGCTAVGVMLTGDGPEYPWWVYLGAPRDDLVIEWIVAATPSERYRRADFEPCAAVCDASCPPQWSTVGDLPLRLEVSGYRLYQRP